MHAHPNRRSASALNRNFAFGCPIKLCLLEHTAAMKCLQDITKVVVRWPGMGRYARLGGGRICLFRPSICNGTDGCVGSGEFMDHQLQRLVAS